MSFWTAFFKQVSLCLYKRSPFSCDAYICHLELVHLFLQSSTPGALEPDAHSEWFGLYRQSVKRHGERDFATSFTQPEFFRKVLDQSVDCFLYLTEKYHELLFRINHVFYSRFLKLVPVSSLMGLFNHLLPKLRLTKDRLIQGDSRNSDTQVVNILHLLGLLLKNVRENEVNIVFKSDVLLDVLTGSLLDRPNLALRHQLITFLGECCRVSKKVTVRLLKKRVLGDLSSLRTLNLLCVLCRDKTFVHQASVFSPKYLRRVVSQLVSFTDSLITVHSPPSACECSLLYQLMLTCSLLLRIERNISGQFFSTNIETSLKRFLSFLDASLRQSVDSLSNTQRAFLLCDYMDLLIMLRNDENNAHISVCGDTKLIEILQEIVKAKFLQHHNIREGYLYSRLLRFFTLNNQFLPKLSPRLISGLLSKVYAFLLRNPSWFSFFSAESYVCPESKSFSFTDRANLESVCLRPVFSPNELNYLLVDFQDLLRNNLTDFPSSSFFFNKESRKNRNSPISDLCNNSYSFCKLLVLEKSEKRNQIVEDCILLIRKLLWERQIKPEILEKFVDSLVESIKVAVETGKGQVKITKEKSLFIILLQFVNKIIHYKKQGRVNKNKYTYL